MTEIENIKARQVLDSRGNPTVEAELSVNGHKFFGIVPSGASTGSREALEMRDGGSEFGGKAVHKAVENVNSKIAEAVNGMDVLQQAEIDNAMIELDGTENKSVLGANAILAVSMAVCRAGSVEAGKDLYEYIGGLAGISDFKLPVPQLNVMNGGRHAGLEEDIQEQMLFPMNFDSFSEALQAGTESYHALKSILKKKFGASATLIGDEGGFVPPVKNTEERLELMLQAVRKAGYEGKISFVIDSAASEFYADGKYKLYGKEYSSGELVDFYAELIDKYPIVSLEDGMAEDDWEGWAMLTEKIGNKVQIVGDDLLVTNTKYIKKAIDEKACNSLLLKINQIGSITESINAAKLAFDNDWTVVVSHRSGETEDSLIADVVVGLSTGQSKFGAPARSERNAKYNQLLRIEEKAGKFAGESVFD